MTSYRERWRERGERIAADPSNFRERDGRPQVRSETRKRWYRLRYDPAIGWRCSCPIGGLGGCKHAIALEIFLSKNGQIPYSPPKLNVSAKRALEIIARQLCPRAMMSTVAQMALNGRSVKEINEAAGLD